LLEIDRGRWEASLAELASADQQFNDDDDAPWRCRVRVTTLRAQTQDLTGRCCTAEDLAGLSAELDQFATLAGDGFLPLWISTARRRFGLSTP
jgi:hypothetical protein